MVIQWLNVLDVDFLKKLDLKIDRICSLISSKSLQNRAFSFSENSKRIIFNYLRKDRKTTLLSNNKQ
ncbi:hypothetical protein [Lactococcus kimchii]|uniref:hypothetical protein n=1 Tax=Lactococcus sp. S-13 TaxID=2507158 RepID=UPI0010232863|nr:hypothetical protein [Lactococcus sp. S-13]RZI48124.1 hypothetical protein EQJ87_00915 [Lactococcus sp. S-13]